MEIFNYEDNQKEFNLGKGNLLKEEIATRKIHNNILSQYSDSLSKENESRAKCSFGIFLAVSIYILISLILVIFNHSFIEVKGYVIGFSISDKVLMALIGSTSINVIGLVTIVLKFMFTNHHHKILDSRYSLTTGIR